MGSLAQGDGWSVREVVCRAGPSDRPFEERHDGFSMSAVVDGSFTYRSGAGHGLLYPGSLLLGNHGQCFECGHAHGNGDRCVSLNLGEDLFGEIAAGAASASRFRFAAPSVASTKALPVVAALEALSYRQSSLAREELALGLAERVIAIMAGDRRALGPPTGRETRRVVEAIRLVEVRGGAAASPQGNGGKRGPEPISLPARLPQADGRDAASLSDRRPPAPRRARAWFVPPAGS